MEAENIHNHPVHSDTKIPVKVDTDIRKAMISNPHLKTSDIVTGEQLLITTGILNVGLYYDTNTRECVYVKFYT